MIPGDASVDILHIDDDPDFTDLSAEFLKREDDRFKIKTAGSASEGLDRLANEQFDCLILDYDMPKQNGIELLRGVREEYPNLPIILFTGKGSEKVASNAISAGVTDYLQKGSDTEQYEILSNRVANAANQYRAERQVGQYDIYFERLQSTIQELLKSTDLESAAERALANFEAITEFEIAGVWLSTDDETVLEPVSISKRSQDIISEQPRYSSDIQSLSWDAYQAQELRHIRDMSAHDERYSKDTPIKSEVIAPLGRHGVLNIGATESSAFTEQEIKLIDLWSDTLTLIFNRITRLRLLQERETELERERDRLEELTASVSHDLQNPLNIAMGRTELAADECDSNHLDDAIHALTRMEELINDSLALAQQGRVVGEMTPVKVENIASRCWQNIESSGAHLHTADTATIQADADRLLRVFENLFKNAIEYGGDSVTITVGCMEDGIYIVDDGVGISDENQSRVFDRGYTRSDDGTGFGLAIVERICEAHGWEISVSTGATGGARFNITGVEFTE